MGVAQNRRRVTLAYDRERVGVVLVEGVEVSEVRWDDGGREPRFVMNRLLEEKGNDKVQ
jgi:hypothetical protein